MNTDIILKSDLLDILFDKRNKSYGAYTLRKFYSERVKTSLLIMLSAAGLFCIAALVKKTTGKEYLTVMEGPVLVNVVSDPQAEKKKTVNPVKKAMGNADKFVSNIALVAEKDTTDKLKDISFSQIGSVTITNGTDIPLAGEETGSDGGGGIVEKTVEEPAVINPEIPVDNAEIAPEYPGGLKALRTFLERNLTNPEEIGQGEIKVQVKFVVGYDGALKGFEIVQDGGTAFNNEVIRVLKKMPKWIPGKTDGRNVSVYHVIPVKFVQNE
ncbi:MAG: energy transducer TonB [Ferruginibacter sp.]